MNLTRKQWPLGWLPVSDELNGNPEGLLRADNLELDELGVISLVNSAQKINSTAFSGEVVQIYSKTINNTKYRYVVLSNGSVLRSNDNFLTSTEIISGQYITRAGFTSVLGQNLICAGNKRLKDDGITIRNLGLRKPDLPPIQIDTPISEIPLCVGDNWFGDSNSPDIYYPPSYFDGKYVMMYAGGGKASLTCGAWLNYWQNYDLSSIGGNPASDDDIFSFFCALSWPSDPTTITVEFHLANPDNEVPWAEYYTYTWKNPQGVGTLSSQSPLDGGTTLKVKRGDFTRVGTHPNLDWSNIAYIFFSFDSNTVSTCYIKNMKFASSFLVGKSYVYASMNVANLDTYVAKSPLSDLSLAIDPVGGKLKILVDDPFSGEDADPQINEVWIFRRASKIIDVTPIGAPPILDKWYRVGVIKPGDSLEFSDTYTDEDALTLNITADERLISIADITEEIIGIVSGYYDRVLYLTAKNVYLSEKLNPDSIAILNTLKFEGGQISQNLWITKSSLGSVLVGTTQDVFEISGTMVDLPDGSIDQSVKPVGVTYPPICYDFDVFSNIVYYMAKDGVRTLSPGGSSDLVTGGVVDLLFNESRHGVPQILIATKATYAYPIALTQNHLFISVPHVDGSRSVIDYNFSTKTWHYRIGPGTNPTSFFVEEDGTILAGYGNGGNDNYLRMYNVGRLFDNSVGQQVRVLTVFDDNQQPRNRKDIFTLKITADTGNVAVNVVISTPEGDSIFLGQYAFNGKEEKLITMAVVVPIRKAYALGLSGTLLSTFKLYNFTIEYNPLPEQLTYLRIPNTNLGSYCRKRFTNFAFVIDTLGNTITFTPLTDGLSSTNSSIVFDGKRTHVHYFTSSTIGTDIGGILSGGVFEYYGLNLEEIVSEKLPTPVKYLTIPTTDYGEPNRKRHSSYKFQIDTKGGRVQFTPRLDGVDKTPVIYTTNEKLTVEYFFTEDTIAIDIGGTLISLDNTEFEFYGVIRPQQIEILPPRLKEFRIPENNYGIAARKRIRTMPMEINTNGYDVTFLPIVDGIVGTPSILNSISRKTLLHYFSTDVFGLDFSGELVGVQPFEFYKLLQPEGVEVLPVAKRLDQIGPIRLDKIGKLLACRFRLIAQASEALTLKFYDEDALVLTGTPIHTEVVNVIADHDEIYEFNFPKTRKGSTIRIVIGPTTAPFHRYDMQLKINFAGMDADPKWLKIK